MNKLHFSRLRVMCTIVFFVLAIPHGLLAQDPCLEFVGGDPHGPIRAVTATGDRMAYGSGRVLMITDLSDASSPETLGELTLDGRIQAIDTSADLAVAVVKQTGVSIIDIADPTSPTQIGLIPLVTWGDDAKIILSGDFAYASTDEELVTIICLRNPSAPEIVASIPIIGSPAIGLEVDHDVLYVLYEWGLTTHRVSDPTSPVEIQTFPVSGSSMAVEWPYVYITDGGSVRVFTTPTPDVLLELNPIVLTTGPNESLKLVDVVDTTAAVVGSGPDGYRIFVLDLDLPDPAAAAVLLPPFTPAYVLTLTESFLFHADDDVGLTITDLSDPATPDGIAHVEAPGATLQVAVAGGRALLQTGFGLDNPNYYKTSGLRLMDVADLTSPYELDSLAVEFGPAPDLLIERGFVYVPSRFTIIDMSDPQHLSVAGASPVVTHGISKRGPLVFGSTQADRIHVFDVSNPTDPIYLPPSGTPLPFAVTDVAMTPEHGYAVGWFGPDTGVFATLNVTDPVSPVVVASIVVPHYPEELEIYGNRAFVRSELGFLIEVDISEPFAPDILSQGVASFWNGDMEISGNVLYDAVASRLRVIDISEPGSPTLRCELITTETIRGIALSGGEVYLAHDTNGLSIYRQFGGALFLDGFEIGTTENWSLVE